MNECDSWLYPTYSRIILLHYIGLHLNIAYSTDVFLGILAGLSKDNDQGRRVSISSIGATLGEMRSRNADHAERDAKGVKRAGTGNGEWCPLTIRLAGLGCVESSPSGIRAGAPTASEFDS